MTPLRVQSNGHPLPNESKGVECHYCLQLSVKDYVAVVILFDILAAEPSAMLCVSLSPRVTEQTRGGICIDQRH